VFLYEQHMPNRLVAVKVMIESALAGDAQRRQFTAEANLMAKVSTHPYIVSVFQADVAPDGRPVIVMEFYPGHNYLVRARTEHFGVAEVLRTGVQVGSALETAHRAGILHRDIKPANILTSEFRRPGLADFGIASAQGPQTDDAGGVSIPWSPPEAFGSADLDVRADVYSLAATLYHLLAGRSPFEVTGGDNSQLAMMSRIERTPVPAIGRADVPPSLERLLAQAMAKTPTQRPDSVEQFLRLLQGVEADLKLAVTPLELADTTAPVKLRASADDDDATRINRPTEILSQGPAVAIDHVPTSPMVTGTVAQRPRERSLPEPDVGDTIHRPTPAPLATDDRPSEQRSRLPLILGGAAVAAAAVVGIALAAGSEERATDAPSTTQAAVVVIGGTRPGAVTGETAVLDVSGTATFSWSASDARADDIYSVERSDTGKVTEVSETSIDLSDATSDLCITVTVLRDGEQDSDPTRWCIQG